MHAYLIIGNKDIETQIDALLKSKKVKEINTRTFEISKVSDVKSLIAQTNFSFNENTAYIINSFEKASVVAQNAFLKRLEEPQENLIFILTANTESAILSTIVSRCAVINIGNQKDNINIENLWKKDINQRFSLIDKVKSREDAIKMLENMLTDENRSERKLNSVLIAMERIKANSNLNLQLSNLVIDLCH